MSTTIKKNEKSEQQKKEKVLPENNTDTSSPTPGSMSEGNLSNNRYGRTKGKVPHQKQFITGSDDDGQAV